MADRFAISAGTVVPMNAPPIKNGAVIVSDGKIENLCEHSKLRGDIPTDNYPHAILLPAFVNAHTHLVYTAYRGLADEADFFTWLTSHIFPLEVHNRESEGRESARLGVRKCFQNGITTLGEQHYTSWGLDAMVESGMKGVMFYEVFGIRTDDVEASLAMDKKFIEDLVRNSSNRIKSGVAPHAPYSVTPPMAALAVEMSDKYKLPISIHVAETHDEVELFLRGSGRFSFIKLMNKIPGLDKKRTPLEYIEELRLLTDRTLLIHGIHLSDSDLDKISDRGCTMITCPTSNAKMAAGIARVGAWVNRGLKICIATDSPASGETFDLFEEMRRFVLMQRALTGKTDKFPAKSVLEMVTTNPAKALGMTDLVGDLRVGSSADMILVKPDLEGAMQYRDVYQTLLWDVTSDKIVKVWADGREVNSS